MNILHTADWHLGQQFYEYDRTEEHQAFLDWLVTTLQTEEIDLLLISGDVFDVANPSAKSQRQFYHFLKEAKASRPSLQTIVTAGNHDSATRLEAPQALVHDLEVRIVGSIHKNEQRVIDYSQLLLPVRSRQETVWVLAIPFPRPGDHPKAPTYTEGVTQLYLEGYAYARERLGEDAVIVAMGHLHAMDAKISEDDRSERTVIGGVEFVPASAFDEGIAYTALGHIHRPQRVGKRENVRYSGSPLPMSFTERNYQHQVVKVCLRQGQDADIHTLHIPITARLRQLPPTPQPLSQVLAALEELPDSTQDEASNLADYLEVQVLLTEPEPNLKHQIRSITDQKAVKLAKITPHYPTREQSQEKGTVQSYEDLHKLQPQHLFERIYQSKFNSQIPDDIQKLFHEVLQSLS